MQPGASMATMEVREPDDGRRRHRRRCPTCGSESVARILYGLPERSDELLLAISFWRGELATLRSSASLRSTSRGPVLAASQELRPPSPGKSAVF
jgi:hypothetical protein